MAGGATTPALVAAVCNAGALGSLAASYLTPEQIASDIRTIRSLTDQPFGVNLFAGGYPSELRIDPAPMLAILSEIHATLGLPAPVLPPWPQDPFNEQLEAVLDTRPAVFSFTFGIPDPQALARLRKRGIAIVGTATTAKEARRLDESGVTAIVAQGAEAGGHRGTFLASFETSMIPTLALVQSICHEVATPVVASGGLMDGRDIVAALRCGAAAAQLGTAFLTTTESGISESYRRALLDSRSDTTVVTRAFSGRPARGLTARLPRDWPEKKKSFCRFRCRTRSRARCATPRPSSATRNFNRSSLVRA
jgi:nitronate monooxygenase